MVNPLLVALIASQARAYVVPDCSPWVYLDLPFANGAVDIPTDPILPVFVRAECGGVGPVEVRLHRVVTGELAEVAHSVEVELEVDGEDLVLLTLTEPMLADTDYAVVVASDLGEEQIGFTTGSTSTAGMGAGIPSLEIFGIVSFPLADDSVRLEIDMEAIPVPDPDDLSYMMLYDARTPDTAAAVVMPSVGVFQGYVYTEHPAEEEACYFVIQTDALGVVSEPSEVACAVPVPYDDCGGCSTAKRGPGLFVSVFAMLLGWRRRNP